VLVGAFTLGSIAFWLYFARRDAKSSGEIVRF
jgi:hypothetical protein